MLKMSNSDRNPFEKHDHELMKHMCKLCNKGFPCGRSLGGHMRSHVINSTDHHHQKKKKKMSNYTEVINGCSNSGDLSYGLREERKNTLKAVVNGSNSNDFMVLDKLCKECGKGFQSWKALFGHMKCHSDKVSKTPVSNQDSWISQRDNTNSSKKRKKSKSRSTNGATTTTTASSSDSMNANHASTSVVSDIDDDDDQEAEIAMCLIMLSRDVGKFGKKRIENGCKMRELAEPESGFLEFKETTINQCEFDDQIKRNFECTTCNKSFHSYHALGGHKASHKKLKGCSDSKTDDNDMIKGEPVLDHDHMINGCSSSFNLGDSFKKTMLVGAHECSICLRIFSSGQALGGHKRSHLVAEAKLNRQNVSSINEMGKPVREIKDPFDLNLPPDDLVEEEQEIGYNPWCYNHESTLLGLLSTS